MRKSKGHPATASGRLLLSAILAVAVALGAGASAWAGPGDLEEGQVLKLGFRARPMAPSQMEKGEAESKRKAEEYVKLAEAAIQQSGKPFTEDLFKAELISVINLKLGKVVGGIVSPDGAIRPDDNHHKFVAVDELIEQYHLDASQIFWNVRILRVFSGGSWDEYAAAMKEHGLGYFPRLIRELSARLGESVGQLYERLPKSFAMLRDSPMRSAVGGLYDFALLEGSWLKPYSQFYLGEKAAEKGIVVESGQEFSEETQLKLRNAIFDDPALRDFLVGLARPEWQEHVRKLVEAAYQAHLRGERPVPDPEGAVVSCARQGAIQAVDALPVTR